MSRAAAKRTTALSQPDDQAAHVANFNAAVYNLGRIDDDYARRLYINYNRRGWTVSEPYDENLAVESPVMVRHAYQALVDREIVVRAQVPADLLFNQDELEQLDGLPLEYFDDLPQDGDVWGFLDSLTTDFPSRPSDGGFLAE